jgi:acyl-coenzyme A thioesterase PaaI-like protein
MRIEAILTPKPHRRRTALAGGLLAALAASATAAVALAAAQTPAGETQAAKWGPIDITADRVQTDKAHHTSLWTGNVSLTGVTKETMNGLFIDGRPAVEADLPKLPETRFATIRATFNANGHELERLDARTTPGAPN